MDIVNSNGIRVWGFILSPFLWMFQRTDSIIVGLILYAIMFVISFVLIAVVAFAFGWIAVLPFWLIGMIDQVRLGNAGAAIFDVIMVLTFYSLFIPFLLWCAKDTLYQQEQEQEKQDEEE